MQLVLNRTCQLLVYAADVNSMGKNMDATEKKTYVLPDASKEVGAALEIHAGKTEHMFMSCHQTTGQNYNINIAN